MKATEFVGRVTALREPSKDTATRKTLVSLVSILGGIASMACCVIPFALFILGVSGAWIGNLTALAPYKPLFIAGTLASLGVGFFMVYRKPRLACADGSRCAQPSSDRTAKIGLWTAAVLVILAITFSYWFPLLVEA